MWLVRDRMSSKVVTIGPAQTLAEAAAAMRAGNFRRLPVVDKGRLVGIVSEFDLRRHRSGLDATPVEAAMTRDPITTPSSETPEHASALMRQHDIGALPVVDLGKLVGIITAKDLMMPEPRPLPEWIPRVRG